MKLANTLEAIALSIDQKAVMALSDIRSNRITAARQKLLDIQQAAWAALNEMDSHWEKTERLSVWEIAYGDSQTPLTVKLDGDGGMFVYTGQTEITDLLMTSTLQSIQNIVKRLIIEANTEDGQ